jgi:acyl-coenzyme A synthetase/AMP-(fatty) acid ligase
MFLLDGAEASRLALVDADGREWTYNALRQSVCLVASLLELPRRSLVFCYCGMDAVTVIAYLAAVTAGHAVALLDHSLPADRRRDLTERYQPELILQGVQASTDSGAGYERLAASEPGFLADRSAHIDPRPIHPELSVLLSTSGTTGSPKFVRLSRRNVESNAASICRTLGIGPSERAIASLPFHYSYGLSVLNSHLLAGAGLVLTSASVIEPTFWARFDDNRCTSFAGVPYTYEMLARIGFERKPLPSLITMTQAGGKLQVPLLQRFHAHMASRGGRFFVMYGQTEATARIACLPSDLLEQKLGSAGRAIPGGTLSIEQDGTICPTGVTGEIVYRGPNVMMGYAMSRDDLGRPDELGGVLRTGDIGHLDRDGFLFVTGRSKRIAKVFGLRVNLDEIESLLRSRGPVAAVPGDDRVRIYCECGNSEDLPAWARELGRAVRINHAAFDVRRVDALPLTPSGKIDYPALQRWG